MNIKNTARSISSAKQFRHIRFLSVIVTFAALLCLTPQLPGEAASGMLDTTFGSGGKVTTDIGNLQNGALSMAIQPDGKIVAGGGSSTSQSSDFTLVRYNPDGALDNTFGTGGEVTIDFGGDDGINAIVLQPDGKIVAAGVTGAFPAYDLALARYNSNGTLDASFGTGGKVITPIGGGNDEAHALALQSDGKIVAAGLSGNYPNIDFALVRYDANGALDNAFGTGGKVLTPIGSLADEADSLLIQPDGKIVAAGFSDRGFGDLDFALARYNADGALDVSFGTGGKVTSQIDFAGETIKELALQADNKIVAAGYTSIGPTFDLALARYNPNGTLDASFGKGGKIITPIGDGDEIATDVVIQPNGKIVAVGWSDNTSIDFALVRYNPDGALDNTFGAGGKVLTPIGNSTDFGFATALQADGKIVVAGTAYNGVNFDFALARYHGDAAAAIRAPFDFDGDAKTDVSIFRPPVGEWWYLKSSDGGAGALQFGLATDKLTPGDFTGDGTTDIAFFRPSTGFWYILRSEDNSFFSFPFGAAGDVPVPTDYDGDGKFDTAVFRPSIATWYILNSGGGTGIVQFGADGDKPVPADFDGDGKADIAIFRPSDGSWWYLQSTNQQFRVYRFGLGTDKPVQGDYTGDGKADLTVFRPSTGEWFIQRSEDNSYFSFTWGQAGDIPAPGDYDGDGKTDAAVFRPSTATWYLNRTTAGVGIVAFGTTGDQPVPNAFVPSK